MNSGQVHAVNRVSLHANPHLRDGGMVAPARGRGRRTGTMHRPLLSQDFIAGTEVRCHSYVSSGQQDKQIDKQTVGQRDSQSSRNAKLGNRKQ